MINPVFDESELAGMSPEEITAYCDKEIALCEQKMQDTLTQMRPAARERAIKNLRRILSPDSAERVLGPSSRHH